MSLFYSKIDWIQNTPTIKVTQGYHGSAQSGQAMDFSQEDLIAPLDLEVTGTWESGQQQYFNAKLECYGNVYIQCVHGKPIRLGKFKKGEVFGTCTWDHWHLAINVNGQWNALMNYIKQDKKIELIGTPWSNPYDNWGFYQDWTLAFEKQSAPAPKPETCEEKLQAKTREVLELDGENASLNKQLKKLQETVKNQETLLTRIEQDNENLRSLANALQSQVTDLDDENRGLAERIIEVGQKEKWDWLKIWKSLMKDGYIQTLVGGAIVGLVSYLIAYVPELAPYRELMVNSLLAILGLQALSKQAEKLKN